MDQIITPSKLEFNNLDDEGSLLSLGQLFSSPEEELTDSDPVLELNKLDWDRYLSRIRFFFSNFRDLRDLSVDGLYMAECLKLTVPAKESVTVN